MTNRVKSETLKRWRKPLTCFVIFAFAALIYFKDLRRNPPGFFIDESSIAYNAFTISQSGHDEHGIAWPLFFRAFGDFKNPTYIYLLAGIYRLTGPSILVARGLSALLGILTALGLGLLARRASGEWRVGLLMIVMSLLTPWLFELSRVALEVAIYPLAVTLFLLCLQSAVAKRNWAWANTFGLAATLAALTYSYSIGRLLAPLLAAGLIFFLARVRWRMILVTWGLYALSLVPLVIYRTRNPGALTQRFRAITYLTAQSPAPEMLWSFLQHFAANINPWRLFISESSPVSEIVHISGAQPMLAATAVAAIAGVGLLLRQRKLDAWLGFILYGLILSVVPASLTKEHFHMLRLCAVPVFVLALTIPALTWLAQPRRPKRALVFAAFIVMTLAQGAYFQVQYQRAANAPRRHHLFDSVFPTLIFPTALAAQSRDPIYLVDEVGMPGYIQAFWYGTLQGIPLERFVRLPPDGSPPEHALVITTESTSPRCRRHLIEGGAYLVCVAEGPPRVLQPLPPDGFKAQITTMDFHAHLVRGKQLTISVLVKNQSGVAWLAREREASPFAISLGDHWLDGEGKVLINDDGRATLPDDLNPGQTLTIPLTINIPDRAGDYQLEIDMLQEGVSWFGLRGSQTLRIPVRVE